MSREFVSYHSIFAERFSTKGKEPGPQLGGFGGSFSGGRSPAMIRCRCLSSSRFTCVASKIALNVLNSLLLSRLSARGVARSSDQ